MPVRLIPIEAEPPLVEADILDRIVDMHRQATTEHSHYYTAVVLYDAHAEITRLRERLATLESTTTNQPTPGSN